MAAARASADPRDRLVVELLARTGMRAGELTDLEADAVVLIGKAYWLRVPLSAWTAVNSEHIRRHRLLVCDQRGPLDRHQVGRIIRRVGRSCAFLATASPALRNQ
jgi:hypothetical protein